MKNELYYLIIGAGGTGGITGAVMSHAGKDVTLIARNRHLEEIRQHGLTVRHLWDHTEQTIPVRACSMEEYASYDGRIPDVVLVCVKGYSLNSIIPFLRQITDSHTIVIPVLNLYGTGEKLQKLLPEPRVMDGCIYVSSAILSPGILVQHGPIYRIVFGPRDHQTEDSLLQKIASDFCDSGISGELSASIQKDALIKFSYVSPIGAAGLYLEATAGDFQKEGPARELFKTMTGEISALAGAMGYPFEKDYVFVNLDILSYLSPDATTSMQRDIMEKKDSEIDGLVFEVIRLGRKYNVPTPAYETVAEHLSLKIFNCPLSDMLSEES